MKISIIHPSRSRPQMFWNTQLRWINRADKKDFEYILSLDSSDIELAHYTLNALSGTKFCVNDNKSAIEAINNAAKIATGDIIVVISDDFSCPEHWDILLLKEVEGKSDFLLKTDDGLQPTLVTLPILDRAYYSRFGYVYHPDYLHLHCDEEMTIVAMMLGCYIKSDLKFEHLHYTTGKTDFDAINAKNNATWAHGQATLDRRAKDNFGIANPLIKREDIQWR